MVDALVRLAGGGFARERREAIGRDQPMHEDGARGDGHGVVQGMFAPAGLQHRIDIAMRHRLGVRRQLAHIAQQGLQARLHGRVVRIGQQLLDQAAVDAPGVGHFGMRDLNELTAASAARVREDQFALALAQGRRAVHERFAHPRPRLVDLRVLGVDAGRAGVGRQ
jgi:hypothetical protein